jgi:hypothetical protein
MRLNGKESDYISFFFRVPCMDFIQNYMCIPSVVWFFTCNENGARPKCSLLLLALQSPCYVIFKKCPYVVLVMPSARISGIGDLGGILILPSFVAIQWFILHKECAFDFFWRGSRMTCHRDHHSFHTAFESQLLGNLHFSQKYGTLEPDRQADSVSLQSSKIETNKFLKENYCCAPTVLDKWPVIPILQRI